MNDFFMFFEINVQTKPKFKIYGGRKSIFRLIISQNTETRLHFPRFQHLLLYVPDVQVTRHTL